MSEGLRNRHWRRFLQAPDKALLDELYVPGLQLAVSYDRCCAYFSSSVLAVAATGFGAFIEHILSGAITRKPAIRLLVNEELSAADLDALQARGDEAPLIEALLKRFGNPTTALQRRRLEMLAWLVRDGWAEVRVGVMRQGGGILHAKFGLFTDAAGDAVIFHGSGNETAMGLAGNYETLDITQGWIDPEYHAQYRQRFDTLWKGEDPAVATMNVPDAVLAKLVKLAPAEPPVTEAEDAIIRQRAAMAWLYAMEAPFMVVGGAETSDALAPVELWPHQGHVVAETASAWPEGRLLCDEVGMGKTVEGILVLRRLLAGRGVRRALILTPANLLEQWQGELREKGALSVPRLEGVNLVWPGGGKARVAELAEALREDVLLLSRETARLDSNLAALLAADPWDLVLLDEAHAARRAEQEEGEFNSATLLLALLRRLQATGQARGVMLLSATPMQTHPWEPWDLLQVLGEGGLWLAGFPVVAHFYRAVAALERGACTRDQGSEAATILRHTTGVPSPPPGLALPSPDDPDAFGRALAFLSAGAARNAAQWLRTASPLGRRMHRNTRRTLRRYYELGLLDRRPPDRVVRDVSFDFTTDAERDVYEAVKDYIDRRFAELEHERPGKGFVMMIYRRRAASSPVALQLSLQRRAEGLRAVIAQRAVADEVPDVEDEAELQDLLNVKLTAGLPDTAEEARRELVDVERLLERLNGIEGLDTKRDQLVEVLKQVCADGRSVLVFTTYADTMRYLRDALRLAFGTSVASYSGEGGALAAESGWQKASKEGVTAALRAGQVRVLVCTDAASEGLNLQAAGAVVNFDLPWNPSKVEQRIGRVDRIGQTLGEVKIANLFLRGSVDERVYAILAKRCRLFESFVGPMQPVLSLAMRMLAGRERFHAEELEREARRIESEPALREAFVEEIEPYPPSAPPLVSRAVVRQLPDRLINSGVPVQAVSNLVFEVGEAGLRMTLEPEGLIGDPTVCWLDGLDARVRAFARSLSRPGERLPLVVATVERGAFRVAHALWVGENGARELRDAADLQALIDRWGGQPPSIEAWLAAEKIARSAARAAVDELEAGACQKRDTMVEAQHEAARLRLTEELGRFLACSAPFPDDLNDRFHRLMMLNNPTADRLQRVFHRLAAYPTWSAGQVERFRMERAVLTGNQIKARLTGTGLDAALHDPRWEVALRRSEAPRQKSA